MHSKLQSLVNQLLFRLLPLLGCLYYHSTSLAIENDSAHEPLLSLVKGEIAVQISSKQTDLAQFAITTLETVDYQPHNTAVGKVLNLQPMFEMDSRLQALAINLLSAKQQQQMAYLDYQRAQELSAQGITSNVKTLKLKQKWLALRASVQALLSQQGYLTSSAQQQWGSRLTKAIIDHDTIYTKLASGNYDLLLIAIPSSTRFDLLKTIDISIDGLQSHATSADFVSKSPFNAQIAGQSYFFISQSDRLMKGARVTAWVPSHDQSIKGVWIPESAIIWYNTKPWVYLQLDAQHYLRRPIQQHHQMNHHWFVPDQFSTGDRIVVSGGAMLLSEELRSQIPEEDDD